MIWGRVPNKLKVDLVAYALIPFAFIGGAFLALNFKTVTIHQTRTVTLTPTQAVARMSGKQLVAALGKPTQVQTQNGITCGVWQSKQIEVCWK